MNIDLTGKRAVICGGSRGIGRAIALACAEAGAAVSICARGAETLAKTRDEIAAYGHKAHAATCDLADKDQIARYIAEAAEALGGIDILVNNASGFGSTDDEEGWEKSINVDLQATVRATRAATPHLEQAGGGAILNISSTAAFHPSVRTTPYSVAKAAVVQYPQPRRGLGQAEHPGQLRRARLDRVSRRQLGAPQDQQPAALQRDPARHPVRPARPSGRGGARRLVPRVAARQLGHRPDDRRRRRPAPRPLSPRSVSHNTGVNRHSGAPRSGEPGIHFPEARLHGFRAASLHSTPGMTNPACPALFVRAN
jgi:short subunit dehydrogenase